MLCLNLDFFESLLGDFGACFGDASLEDLEPRFGDLEPRLGDLDPKKEGRLGSSSSSDDSHTSSFSSSIVAGGSSLAEDLSRKDWRAIPYLSPMPPLVTAVQDLGHVTIGTPGSPLRILQLTDLHHFPVGAECFHTGKGEPERVVYFDHVEGGEDTEYSTTGDVRLIKQLLYSVKPHLVLLTGV
jgi:hypothetical protein